MPYKKIFLSFPLFLFLFGFPFSHANDSQNTFTGGVIGVTDGGTISVMRGGKAVEVLLHGIDCAKKKQAYGTRAKRFNSDKTFRNEVRVSVKDTNRYGRSIAWSFSLMV